MVLQGGSYFYLQAALIELLFNFLQFKVEYLAEVISREVAEYYLSCESISEFRLKLLLDSLLNNLFVLIVAFLVSRLGETN